MTPATKTLRQTGTLSKITTPFLNSNRYRSHERSDWTRSLTPRKTGNGFEFPRFLRNFVACPQLLPRPQSSLTATHQPNSELGAETVEFALVLLPLFTFVFALISVSWLIFAKASLQHAVREGVRVAITSKSEANIRQVFETNAFGFASTTYLKSFTVKYYNPTTLNQAETNAGGNMVEVYAQITIPVLAPFGPMSPTITISADSSDVMESGAVSSGGS